MGLGFDGGGLAVGSVFGIRWWNLKAPDGIHLRLHGVQAPWQPGENIASCAACRPGRECMHSEVPDENCGCGFWAYWTVNAAPLYGQRRVMGVVEGYGRTLIGDKGFRCEKARIVALCCQFTEEQIVGTQPHYSQGPPPGVLFKRGGDGMKAYLGFGGRPYGVYDGEEYQYGDDLARQVALEGQLEDVYQVPVYTTAKYMLLKHPPTTDYLPADAPEPDWAAIKSATSSKQWADIADLLTRAAKQAAESIEEARKAALSAAQAMEALNAKYAAWQLSEPADDGTTVDQALERLAAPLAPPIPPSSLSKGLAQFMPPDWSKYLPGDTN